VDQFRVGYVDQLNPKSVDQFRVLSVGQFEVGLVGQFNAFFPPLALNPKSFGASPKGFDRSDRV